MSKIAVWRNHNNGEEGEMPYDDWLSVAFDHRFLAESLAFFDFLSLTSKRF